MSNSQVEAALAMATQAAEQVRRDAFDVVKSLDAAAARKSLDEAQFTVQRLNNVLPRLRQRHLQVDNSERLAAARARVC